MNPPSEIIAQMIHDENIAGFGDIRPDWALTFGKMPEQDDHDECVTTYDFGSKNDGRTMRTGYIVHPKVQIRVRSLNYSDGYAKADEIKQYLTSGVIESLPLTVTVPGGSYVVQNVSLLGDVAYMGQDEKNQRQHFSLNVMATISEA